MKYSVEIKETLSRVVVVDATSEEQAIELAHNMYKNCELVLDENDYVDYEIALLDNPIGHDELV